MTDPYKILGVSPTASDDEIKQAYRDLVRKYHPDKYANTDLAEMATEKMKEVNAAYEEVQRRRKAGEIANDAAAQGNHRVRLKRLYSSRSLCHQFHGRVGGDPVKDFCFRRAGKGQNCSCCAILGKIGV